jgi:SHS2 domain-containing protein
VARSLYRSNVPFTFLPHTADVRIHVEAATREELFGEALRAIAEYVRAGDRGDAVSCHVTVESVDLTSLLVDFLNDALWRLHARGELYDGADIGNITDMSIEATLHGSRVGAFEEDVKAVTYHDAEVRCVGGVWSTLLVLDI